LVSRPTG